MKDLTELRRQIVEVFADDHMTEVPKDEFSSAKYPKLLPVMSCTVDRYRMEGFGQMMTMHGKAKIGMEILTVAMMPYEGSAVPFMLADAVIAKNKCTLMVEYYDCTADRPAQPFLEETAAKYSDLKAYDEKPAWYTGERAAYSLIKEGSPDDVRLEECILDSFRAYRRSIQAAGRDSTCPEGLKAFRYRMIHEGNPATEIMNKVLGKDGAEAFFKKCVMPLNSKGE